MKSKRIPRLVLIVVAILIISCRTFMEGGASEGTTGEPTPEKATSETAKVYIPFVNSSKPEDPTPTAPNNGNFYVSPAGSSKGNGSLSRPWDLQTAFDHPASVKPGDIIWLLGGDYKNSGETEFKSKLKGVEGKPVIVRLYPGERAIVYGGIMAYGEWTWFWGFEITNTAPRHLAEAERNRRGPGLGLYGAGQKAINLIIYNAGHPGISFGEQVVGGEIYGCIIWGSGFYQDGSARGSAIYGQNETEIRLISDVISFRNFTTGMKTWSESAHGNGFIFDGNVSFDNGDRNIFAGSSNNALQNLTLTNNYTYRRADDIRIGVQLGYSMDLENKNLLVKDNYLVNGDRAADNAALGIISWSSGVVERNTIIARNLVAAYYESYLGSSGSRLTWNDNSFYGPVDNFWYTYSSGLYDYLKYENWGKKVGLNGSNAYIQAMPKGTQSFIRENKYEPNRAHIVVYNWGLLKSININPSKIMQSGDKYVVLDAQNYFGGPVASGTYNGGSIALPMNLDKVALVTGNVDHIKNRHTAPEFAVFVLIVQDE